MKSKHMEPHRAGGYSRKIRTIGKERKHGCGVGIWKGGRILKKLFYIGSSGTPLDPVTQEAEVGGSLEPRAGIQGCGKL